MRTTRKRAALALTVSLAVTLLAACGGSSGPAASPTPTTSSSTGSTAASPTAPTTPAEPALPDWPTYHGSPARTGLSTTMPPATTAKVLQRVGLDGEVFASPLVIGGLTIVATEHDTVYAFDRAYRSVWKTSLGSPSPAEERQCGDINPLGITGTPVYDRGSGLLFLVAEHGGTVRHELVALRASSGQVAWRRGVDLPGVSARDMQQRGALAIAQGRVWVSFGAQAGDCGDYKGRVVGIPLTGQGAPVFYSPPTRRGGGIWNPNGPTVDQDGNLLVVSANGAAFPGDAYDHTNSVLKLDGNARLLDSFAPSDWAENNRGDVGLGSQGVALVGSQWAVLGGKSGPVYVLRRDALGGIGGQVDVKQVCPSFGGAAVDGTTVYLPCTDGVRAVRVDATGHLSIVWHADRKVTGSPVVGGGKVWALDPQNGVLHALDPQTGASAAAVAVGEANRFATPALYGADVIVPTLAGFTVVRTS